MRLAVRFPSAARNPAAPNRARWRSAPGLWVLSFVSMFVLGCERTTTPRPPNLVLITVDTLRADHIGALGYELDTSPHLDRLAARGVLFTDVTVTWPMTWPTTASLLTGRYPKTTGVRRVPVALPDRNQTLAEILDAAGYRTAAVVSNANLGVLFGYDQGFDFFVESWLDAFRKETGSDDYQRRGPAFLKRFTNAEIVTDQGLALLDQIRGSPPFFLWLHYLDPHGPYVPPSPYKDLFLGSHPSESLEVKDIPGYQRISDGGKKTFHTDLAWYQAQYDGEIRRFDDQLERLLNAMDERGLIENSLVVLTADHGESFGEGGLYLEHGRGPFQSTARVPLLVAGGDLVPSGRTVDEPVGSVDVLPTILDLLGLSPASEIDGTSLEPLVAGRPGAAGPRYVFMESGIYETSTLTVRDGRWKLVWLRSASDHDEFGRGKRLLLFDLVADPQETTNVAARHPEIVERLEAALREWAPKEEEEAAGEPKALDPTTQRALEALGYIEPDGVAGPQ